MIYRLFSSNGTRPRALLAWLALAMAVLPAACSDDATAPGGSAFDLEKVRGDEQTRFAGWELPQELRVQLTAPDGSEARTEGVTVEWSVRTGGGTVSPASATTSTAGWASAHWTLGPTLGAQSVAAVVPGGDEVVFTARAVETSGPIAFSAEPPWDPGRFHLFTVQPDGSELVQLASSEASTYLPRWSPDGATILADRRDVGLVLLDERGELLDVVVDRVEGVALGGGHGWSPDGSSIIVSERAGNPECDGGTDSGNLYVVDVSTGAGTALTSGCDNRNAFPDWSPDGEWIVFQSERDSERGVYAIRPDGSDEQAVLTGSQIEFPRWDPAGSSVFAVSIRGFVDVGGAHPDSNAIVTLDMGGEIGDTLVVLGDSEVPVVDAWSPDGSALLYTRRIGGSFDWILTRLEFASEETFPLAGGGVVSGGINGSLEFPGSADWK